MAAGQREVQTAHAAVIPENFEERLKNFATLDPSKLYPLKR
jgi:hypothetical protein